MSGDQSSKTCGQKHRSKRLQNSVPISEAEAIKGHNNEVLMYMTYQANTKLIFVTCFYV